MLLDRNGKMMVLQGHHEMNDTTVFISDASGITDRSNGAGNANRWDLEGRFNQISVLRQNIYA